MAKNGIEAFEELDKNEFDLILLDLQMPKLDGYQIAKLLKDKSIVTPIIAVSAHVFQADKEKAKKAGMVDFITKPIDMKEFQFKLKKHLS